MYSCSQSQGSKVNLDSNAPNVAKSPLEATQELLERRRSQQPRKADPGKAVERDTSGVAGEAVAERSFAIVEQQTQSLVLEIWDLVPITMRPNLSRRIVEFVAHECVVRTDKRFKRSKVTKIVRLGVQDAIEKNKLPAKYIHGTWKKEFGRLGWDWIPPIDESDDSAH